MKTLWIACTQYEFGADPHLKILPTYEEALNVIGEYWKNGVSVLILHDRIHSMLRKNIMEK